MPSKEDTELEEAYYTQEGTVPRSKIISSEAFSKLPEELKRQLESRLYDPKMADKLKALKSILSKTEGNAGEPSHKKQTRRPEGDTAENYDNREYKADKADKSKKKKKYPALTDRQNELAVEIESEKDSDNQYYYKAWKVLLEKNNDVDKIITDLARKIKDPEKREDIIQRQAEQKVKETIKAWKLLFKGRFDDANSRMINTLRSRGVNARLSKKPCVHCGEGEKLVEMQDDKGNWSTSNINAMHHTTSTPDTGNPNTHEGEICPDCEKKQTANEYGKKLGAKEFQEANKAWEVLFKGRKSKVIIPEGSTYKDQIDAKDKKRKKHKLISPKLKKPISTGAKGDSTMEVVGRKGDVLIPTKGKILGHPRSERVYQEGKWSKAFRGDNSKQTGKKILSGIRALKSLLKNRNL